MDGCADKPRACACERNVTRAIVDHLRRCIDRSIGRVWPQATKSDDKIIKLQLAYLFRTLATRDIDPSVRP